MSRPHIGQIVQYHRRSDEGRPGGGPIVPAVVMEARPDGCCALLIIFGADDFLARWGVPPKSETNPLRSWSLTQVDARIAELKERLEALEQGPAYRRQRAESNCEEVLRKQLRRKKRSCGLCKPWKRCLENRWKVRQRDALVRADREMRAARAV